MTDPPWQPSISLALQLLDQDFQPIGAPIPVTFFPASGGAASSEPVIFDPSRPPAAVQIVAIA